VVVGEVATMEGGHLRAVHGGVMEGLVAVAMDHITHPVQIVEADAILGEGRDASEVVEDSMKDLHLGVNPSCVTR
jgi:hypothetical protein